MALAPGTRLGHYEILATLGAGGMGEVYRAADTTLGRHVALKVLPAALAGDPERIERFRREARAVAALNHPHIVTIHSVELADGVQFLTMELVRFLNPVRGTARFAGILATAKVRSEALSQKVRELSSPGGPR